MIMNLLVVAAVLGIGYAWLVRGFFNAFLHLLCTVFAGAIAFAVWEPLAHVFVGMAPARGLFTFIGGIAWSAALILPFSVALVLLRLIADKTVPANLNNAVAADYAGGAICGLGSGIITAGITVIAIGHAQLPDKFFGYQPVYFSQARTTGAGSIARKDTLWIPADALVAKLYRNLSTTTLSTAQPLAAWYPTLELDGMARRLTPGGGSGLTSIKYEDIRLMSIYSVGSPTETAPVRELTVDSRDSTPQPYQDIDGNSVSSAYLFGAVVEFQPGAKEHAGRSGQVMVGNGPIWVTAKYQGSATDENDAFITVHPFTVISQASAGEDVYARWRFDGDEVFISSVGGASKVPMAFEFIMPAGYSPTALTVRGRRFRLDDDAPRSVKSVELPSIRARDRLISDEGALLRGESVEEDLDTSNAVIVTAADSTRGGDGGIRVSNKLPRVLHSAVAGRVFTLNDQNMIVTGQGQFSKDEMGNRPQARSLRVDKFVVGKDQVMVQIDVSRGQVASLVTPAARLLDGNLSIRMIDTRGVGYDAVGYIYADRDGTFMRYTTEDPLDGTDDTPQVLSTSREDQELKLIFVCSYGVKIQYFAIGNTVLATLDPPLELNRRQD